MEAHLASNITVDYPNRVIYIDGQEFPFSLALAGPTIDELDIEYGPAGLVIVHLPVLARSFDTIGKPQEGPTT